VKPETRNKVVIMKLLNSIRVVQVEHGAGVKYGFALKNSDKNVSYSLCPPKTPNALHFNWTWSSVVR
jgi:hypothetical protein